MRYFVILCFLLIGSTICGHAQVQTATLQHGEETTIFYGYRSFADAYEESTDGDVITLSSGNFDSVGEVAKSVSIVGNYAFSANDSVTSINRLTISGKNVRISGIRIPDNLRMNLSENLKVRRCYIENLVADTTHISTLIEDCAINNDFSLPAGVHESYRRTEIFRHHWGNTPDNMAVFEYCTILNPVTEQVDITYNKGVKHWHNQLASYGTYNNCAIYWSMMEPGQSLAQASLYFNQQSDYHDVMLFGGLYGTVSFVIRDGTIANHIMGKFMDGDEAGAIKNNFPGFFADEIVIPELNGTEYKAPVGCHEHKSWPAIPRIIESKVDRETDADGNLNIFIKLSRQD